MRVEDLLIRIQPSAVDPGDPPSFQMYAGSGPGEVFETTLHLPTRERLRQLATALAGPGDRDFHLAAAAPGREDLLRGVGEELSRALFQGELSETWGALVGRGARPRHRLRLRFSLRLDVPGAGVLGEIPWEALVAPRNGRFVGLEPGFSIVRYVEQRGGDEAPPRPRSLRVLAVTGVDLPGQPRLDLEGELEGLAAALRGPRAELTILRGATRGDLRRSLEERRPHVLHFLGHGGFDAAETGGALYLAGEIGGVDRVPADLLAQGLKRAVWRRDEAVGCHGPGLRLVVLNACRTAQVAAEMPFSGVATRLVRDAGVPAVVAMQYPVRDRSAIEFSREFYRRLAAGDSLEEAVQEGRDRMQAVDPCDWVAPALYSRLEGGRLFAEEGAAEATVSIPGLPGAAPSRARVLGASLGALLWILLVGGIGVLDLPTPHSPGTLPPTGEVGSEPSPVGATQEPVARHLPPVILAEGSPVAFDDLGVRLAVHFQSELHPDLVTLHFYAGDTFSDQPAFAGSVPRFETPDGTYAVELLDVDPLGRTVKVRAPRLVT